MSNEKGYQMKFSQILISAINAVNQDVAYEIDFEGVKRKDRYLVVAETCIDANRLKSWGYPEADDELHALIKEHGWPAVLAEAAKHVALP